MWTKAWTWTWPEPEPEHLGTHFQTCCLIQSSLTSESLSCGWIFLLTTTVMCTYMNTIKTNGKMNWKRFEKIFCSANCLPRQGWFLQARRFKSDKAHGKHTWNRELSTLATTLTVWLGHTDRGEHCMPSITVLVGTVNRVFSKIPVAGKENLNRSEKVFAQN